MNESLLIANAGSSSIKFAVYSGGPDGLYACTHRGELQSIGGEPRLKFESADGTEICSDKLAPQSASDHAAAIERVISLLKSRLPNTRWAAMGHRVVHGAEKFLKPALIDAGVVTALEEIVPLNPLHQPQSLAVIKKFLEIFPDVPQIACFDTAFHATQPKVATEIALPRRFAAEGVKRYGFHGLSYEYIASALPGIAPKVADGKVIVAHLGNGASLCAMQSRRCVATTMGFSVLDGLVMGTRCGLLDPGVLIYLMDRHGMGPREIEKLLYSESGLLGVSGISNDMRVLTESADPRAKDAVELFIYRAVREIGSLTAALGGLDALVFTAGIGEHSPLIRAGIARRLSWLGVDIDEAANAANRIEISNSGAKVPVFVIPTDESEVIARHTAALLARRRSK